MEEGVRYLQTGATTGFYHGGWTTVEKISPSQSSLNTIFLIVFKNVCLDASGKEKLVPRHVLINDKNLEILSPLVSTNSDIKSFLSELKDLQLSETMTTRAVFVSLFSLYLFFYPIHKWQNDSVPGLILTSIEPEAQKTTVMKLVIKLFSNLKTNVSNLCGTNEGISSVTTKSTLIMYRDDMESKRKRNVQLVKNYDATQTHTVGRGMSVEIAASIGSENLGN